MWSREEWELGSETGDEGGVGGYYEEIWSGEAGARMSGWRRRIGQWARFEMALAPWPAGAIESVLDLGCGTGALYDYLERTGRDVRYAGIDMREEAVEEGRKRHRDAAIRVGNFYETNPGDSFDLVVAVGSYIDGRPARSRGDRLGRIRRLVRRERILADVGFSCVVLDQGALTERAALDLEPALFGVTAAEFEEIVAAESRSWEFVEGALTTDLACAALPASNSGAPAVHFDRVDGEKILERVARLHRSSGGAVLDEAWLWLEAGANERVRAVLEGVEERTPEYRLLVDRLRLSERGD